MEEYVAKSILKKELNIANLHSGIIDALQNIVDEIPAANVQEVKHAHWIPKQYPFGDCECSNCHEAYGICGGLLGDYNFCPNCGAKMDGR